MPGAVPPALFDLAINRAVRLLRQLRPAQPQPALLQWHARTRFARRVPLEVIVQIIQTWPEPEGWRSEALWHWRGGPQGRWEAGEALWP